MMAVLLLPLIGSGGIETYLQVPQGRETGFFLRGTEGGGGEDH